MGSFANALFTVLLGWLQGAAAWLWRVITGADVGAWMDWVLDNWLALVLLLCLAGVLIDLVVYLLRWQPYRVWRRFLHRKEEEPDEEEAPELALPRSKWVYADGTSVPAEEKPAALPVETNTTRHRALSREEEHLDAPVRPIKRVIPAKVRKNHDSGEFSMPEISTGEQAYHQPYYPPQWTNPDKPRANRAQRGGHQ